MKKIFITIVFQLLTICAFTQISFNENIDIGKYNKVSQGRENEFKSQIVVYLDAMYYCKIDVTVEITTPESLIHIMDNFQVKTVPELKQKCKGEYIRRHIHEANIYNKLRFIIGDVVGSQIIKGDVLCVIEYDKVFDTNGKKEIYPSALLCISNDKGVTWKFSEIDPQRFSAYIRTYEASYSKDLIESFFLMIDTEYKRMK